MLRPGYPKQSTRSCQARKLPRPKNQRAEPTAFSTSDLLFSACNYGKNTYNVGTERGGDTPHATAQGRPMRISPAWGFPPSYTTRGFPSRDKVLGLQTLQLQILSQGPQKVPSRSGSQAEVLRKHVQATAVSQVIHRRHQGNLRQGGGGDDDDAADEEM